MTRRNGGSDESGEPRADGVLLPGRLMWSGGASVGVFPPFAYPAYPAYPAYSRALVRERDRGAD